MAHPHRLHIFDVCPSQERSQDNAKFDGGTQGFEEPVKGVPGVLVRDKNDLDMAYDCVYR